MIDVMKVADHADMIINGYPPVTIDDVYKEVLEQTENFKKYAK